MTNTDHAIKMANRFTNQMAEILKTLDRNEKIVFNSYIMGFSIEYDKRLMQK